MTNHELYMQYKNKIKTAITKICYQYSLKYLEEDIEQELYFYFMELIDKYNPNYNGNTIPLDCYLFKNINLKIKSLCQKEKTILGRAIPSEIYPQEGATKTEEQENNLRVEEILKVLDKLPNEIKQIIILNSQGYTQKEITNRLCISQSKVSNILKAIKNNDASRYDIQPLIDYKMETML